MNIEYLHIKISIAISNAIISHVLCNKWALLKNQEHSSSLKCPD